MKYIFLALYLICVLLLIAQMIIVYLEIRKRKKYHSDDLIDLKATEKKFISKDKNYIQGWNDALEKIYCHTKTSQNNDDEWLEIWKGWFDELKLDNQKEN